MLHHKEDPHNRKLIEDLASFLLLLLVGWEVLGAYAADFKVMVLVRLSLPQLATSLLPT